MLCHQITSTKTNLYTYLNKRLVNYIKFVITVKRDCKIFNWIWDRHILQCNMNFECWTQSQNLKQKEHCEVWGSHASVAENSSPHGRDAALLGEVTLVTFWRIVVSSQSNNPTRKTLHGPLDPDGTTLHNVKNYAPSDETIMSRKTRIFSNTTVWISDLAFILFINNSPRHTVTDQICSNESYPVHIMQQSQKAPQHCKYRVFHDFRA